MLCREQFLKFPPEKLNLRISPSTPNDIDNKIQRSNTNKYVVSDDGSNWMTDDDDDSDEDVRPSPRRRNKEIFIIHKQIELRVMRKIFEAQSDEVKRVIVRLHQMQLNQRKVMIRKQQIKEATPRPLSAKKITHTHTKQSNKKKRSKVASAGPLAGATLQNNRKILARLQRRRHQKRKPKKKTQKRRKKFPRRRRRANAKSGNRQHRKRTCRSQKFFNKGVFFTARKLMEQIWQSVKDPQFRNSNEFPGLTKLHLQQIAVYEKIEEDLERLSITRQERTKAAEERKAKQLEKAELRKDLENKIMAKAAAHAENDALRKERRAARKKRALDKKQRQQTAKAEIRLYCKNVV